MKRATYVIVYTVFLTTGKSEEHTTKVNNCLGDLHAKVELEAWLKRKYTKFQRLEITSCNKDIVDLFSDIFGFKK